jgi:hypothetical protein
MNKSLLIKHLLFSLSVTAAVCTSLISVPARGQAVESVQIERRANATEINIRFMTYVQYLRHAPVDFGKSMRIYIQFTGGGVEPGDLVPRTQRFPRSEEAPEISVSFPEFDNSLMVSFDQPTKFEVRPSPDGRGIIVRLPPATTR